MTKTALLTLVVTLFFAQSALAEDVDSYECTVTKTSPEDEKAARAAFELGRVAYTEKGYDNAIRFWKEAYRRDCTATLLIRNIGLAYEGAQNYEQALAAYHAFVDQSKDPKDPSVVEVKAKIEVLGAIVLDRKIEQMNATVEAPASPTISMATASVADTKVVTQPKVESPSRWAPITVTVVGGAAALIGGGIYVDALLERRKIEGQCANYTCPDDGLKTQGNDARSRVKVGSMIAVSGLTVAAIGTAWLIFGGGGSTTQEKPIASIHPWVGAKGGGVSYQGTF